MYCPVCQEVVQAKREDINWAILVLLTIFTAGIGTLIYLSVWLKKPFDHCTTCNSLCNSSKGTTHKENSSNQDNSNQMISTDSRQAVKKDNMNQFCTNCGAELDIKAQFCAYCGSNL